MDLCKSDETSIIIWRFNSLEEKLWKMLFLAFLEVILVLFFVF